MKKYLPLLTHIYFPWILGIAGVPILAYGIWFQTEGFTLVAFIYCLLVLLIGGFVGYVLTQRVCSMKNIHMKDVESMMPGYELTAFLCLIIVYVSTSVIFFLIGIGAFGLAVASIWYYLIYRNKVLKEASAGTVQ